MIFRSSSSDPRTADRSGRCDVSEYESVRSRGCGFNVFTVPAPTRPRTGDRTWYDLSLRPSFHRLPTLPHAFVHKPRWGGGPPEGGSREQPGRNRRWLPRTAPTPSLCPWRIPPGGARNHDDGLLDCFVSVGPSPSSASRSMKIRLFQRKPDLLLASLQRQPWRAVVVLEPPLSSEGDRGYRRAVEAPTPKTRSREIQEYWTR